jgi:antitoxin YefM
MTDEALSLGALGAQLAEVVERVETTHERVLVTRDGHPAAVLISPDDLAALEETLDLLSDPQALARIQAAREDIAAGRVVTEEELAARYLRR